MYEICRCVARWRIVGLMLLVTLFPINVAAKGIGSHFISVDDVLDTVSIDQIAPSPDGEHLAVVVQRPARDGEIFGRTAYEIDPSRNDVWLVSRRTRERRNITRGASNAAGFWCAAWSPDGRHLAMLSTLPEHGEPRGGNNVRLYLWDKAPGRLRRLSDLPMMTQTRYGSPLNTLDLRGGPKADSAARSCRAYEENSPFLWLDNRRILTVTLPEGSTSALLDQFGRPFDHTASVRHQLSEGRIATVTAAGSGSAKTGPDKSNRAILRTIDVTTGEVIELGNVPTYPFQGALTLSVSPDGLKLAILATLNAIPPSAGRLPPHNDDAWRVEKQLGVGRLDKGAPIRWANLPKQARYPLELLGWSHNSRMVAFRAREQGHSKVTAFFIAAADSSFVTRVGVDLVSESASAGPYPHGLSSIWTNDDQLLVRARDQLGARDDWWLASVTSKSINLTAALVDPPSSLRISRGATVIGISSRKLISIDPTNSKLKTVAGISLPSDAVILWPAEGVSYTSNMVISSNENGNQRFDIISAGLSRISKVIRLPNSGELIGLHSNSLIWRDATSHGLFLRETPINGSPRQILALNDHLANVKWGANLLIDYRAQDGSLQKASVILPPSYKKGQRYPVITWVYSGYVVRGSVNYWTDFYLPGLYNLQLYAAKGFVVLVPSMPWKRSAANTDSYPRLTNGVIPAIDRLTDLKIADPARVGVMGQSFGGYTVYSLITQTNRFKAAIAMAGVTDLAQGYLQFDPSARGYPGIEHEKSINGSIFEISNGLGVPPYGDADLYRLNSPLAYVAQVQTPILLVHGEYDVRGTMSQADTFFQALYRQGKTARLLRYWGESHSLAQSPANIRSIFDESVAWFTKYLSVKSTQKEHIGIDQPPPSPGSD